ncbi:MAG: hypothetical protein H0V39_04010 [Nitrosomonas sp.]|nr:hypothetical protein [Nitrosomonas sp.]
MEAAELIEFLRVNDYEVKADGEYIDVSPAEKITEELIHELVKHKPAILKESRTESRRQKVLSMLAESPDKQRAYVADMTADLDNVILTVAIKGVATFEMLIPKNRYDPFFLIEIFNKELLQ